MNLPEVRSRSTMTNMGSQLPLLFTLTLNLDL
jgi:hypothetical protein